MDGDGNGNDCAVRQASDTWKKPADFPAINPAFSGLKNEFMYAGTTSGARRFLPDFPFDSIAKINCSGGAAATWTAGRRRFVGEPVFVPRRSSASDEDDGYILVVEVRLLIQVAYFRRYSFLSLLQYAVRMRKCYLVILDARKIGRTEGVVARIEVPKELNFPLGFHGFWSGNAQTVE